VDLPDSDLSENVKLITGDAARIQSKAEVSVGLLSQLLVEMAHMPHPGGTFGRNRGEFNQISFGSA
jgi:hypothetical protein